MCPPPRTMYSIINSNGHEDINVIVTHTSQKYPKDFVRHP